MSRIYQVEFWIYSLLSAFIGGGASALGSDEGVSLLHRAGSAIEPLSVHQLAVMFLAGGISCAVAYLKKSPLPAMPAPSVPEKQPQQ